MLKNILKLDGAQKLSKNEQKNIHGGVCQNQYLESGYTRAECKAAGGSPRVNGMCLLGSC